MTVNQEEDPAYLLSATGLELERLRKQHEWIVSCLDGKLIFAPVDLQKPQLKVLDVGCADGTLLRYLQGQMSPTAELVGVDILTTFLPKTPQGNISFALGDVGEPPAPERTGVFDLTHVRFLLAWALTAGADKVIKNLADTLAPGGWLQVTELEVPEEPQQCTAWNDMMSLMALIFNKTGVGASYASKLGGAFERAGLKNVTVQKVELPAGRKFGDGAAALDSLLHFKITTPTILKAIKDLGIEVESSMTDNLEERFERDMMAEGAVFTSYIIYGQKA